MSADGAGGSGLKVIGVVLLVLGVLFVALGAVYFAVNANQLPSFLGKVAGKAGDVHRTKRGIASLVVGGLCLVASGFALTRPKKP
jgi:hypothetical protein